MNNLTGKKLDEKSKGLIMEEEMASINLDDYEDINNLKEGKYIYFSKDKVCFTDNPAMASRHNAKDRYFAMSKTKKVLSKISGQWSKFSILWERATYTQNIAEQNQISRELDELFRR